MNSLCNQPYAERRTDTTDRIKARMRIRPERLIQSLAGQAGSLGDLAHTPRTRNITQGGRKQGGIVIFQNSS